MTRPSRARQRLVATAAAMAVLAGAQAAPWTGLRAVLALPVMLVLPGAALAGALLGPDAVGAQLTGRPRGNQLAAGALYVMLSLVFFVLLSLAFAALSIRLSTLSYVVATELAVTMLVPLSARQPGSRPGSGPEQPPPGRPAASSWAVWAVAATTAGTLIVVLGVRLFPQAAPIQFTRVALGGSWSAVSGSVAAAPGSSIEVPVVVSTTDRHAGPFQLGATFDGAPFGAGQTVRVDRTGKWSGSVTGLLTTPGCLHRLVIALSGGAASDAASVNVLVETPPPGTARCAT